MNRKIVLYNTTRIMLSLLLVLPMFFTASATLTAKTVQYIKGTPPYLADPDGNKITDYTELLKIKVGDGNDGFTEYKGTQTVSVPRNVNMSDITAAVPYVTTSDYLTDNGYTVSDDDGDTLNTFNGQVYMSFRKNGLLVAKSDIEKLKLTDCETYQLQVSARYINISSQYGAPQTDSTQTPIGTQTDTYVLSTDRPAICYAKTLEMSLTNNAGFCLNDWANRHNCVYSQGYNPKLFDKTNGFILSALQANNVPFPVTAFPGAQFTLVGSGSESNWSCSSSNNVALSLSGCTIKFKSKLTSPATITMTHNSGLVEKYIIPATQTWLEPSTKSMAYYDGSTYPAASYCQNGTTTSVTTASAANSHFISVANITNSPITLNPFIFDGNKRYSRDADKTVMGEWGVLTAYPDSNFAFLGAITSTYKDIWTSELNKAGYQFSVQVQTGEVRASSMSIGAAYAFAACKK